jgi:intein/homing endonuclease
MIQSHTGQRKHVTKVYRRPYSGKLIKIRPGNFGITASLTPEHPVLAITRRGKEKFSSCIQQDACWIPASLLRKGDIVLYPINKEEHDVDSLDISAYLDFEWKNHYRRGLVRNEDVVFYTCAHGDDKRHKIPIRIKLNDEIFRLFGYYVAEGYVTATDNAIVFSFHTKEKDYVEDVKHLMMKYFAERTYHERVRNGRCEITYSSRILTTLMKNLFGSRAKEKSLPHWMLSLPKSKQLQLMIGLLRGDGCLLRSRLGYDRINYKTASRILTHQIKEILLRFGIVPSIVENEGYSYDIHLSGQTVKLLTRIVWGIRSRTSGHLRRRSKIEAGYVYLPIHSVRQEDYSGEVLNLEVEDDNSYALEGLAIHNCVVESQAAGTVPIVAYGGGQVETVTNGETGFLVSSREEMVNRMELLVGDDLTFKRMSEKAMEKAKLFSNESFAKKWIDLIEEVTS